MGHNFGLEHARSDNRGSKHEEYGDSWDVMGGAYWHPLQDLGWYRVKGGRFGEAGPGLGGTNVLRVSGLPANRVVVLTRGPTPQTRTLTLTGVQRPEGAGALLVRIEGGSVPSYDLELRLKERWDAAIPTPAVFIREIDGNSSRLITMGGGPEWTTGEVFRNGTQVAIDSIDTALGLAQVTVSY
jgi:hypothetical protein